MKNKLFAGISKTEISTDAVLVNDPLYAKILVFICDDKKYAFVSLDYISMGGGISELSDCFFANLKEQAEKRGIDTLVCGVTHTHTLQPMILEEKVVTEKIFQAMEKATENAVPVTVGSGKGKNTDFIINRTLSLKDGSAWTIRQAHPCPPDSEISAIETADETIGVVRIDKEDKTPLCVLFTFGCHPLLGYANNLPTGNFPGIAAGIVEQHTGAMAMMFQSCGGDVTEVDYKNYDKPKNCEVWGKLLGLSVLDVVKDIKTENADICSCIKSVTLPRRCDIPEIREKLFKERDELVLRLGNCPLNFKAFLPLYMKYLTSPEFPLGYAYEYMREEGQGKTHLRDQDKINRANIEKYLENLEIMEKLSKLASTLETIDWHERYNATFENTDAESEVVGIRLGDTVFVTAPVEPLSEIGRKVCAESPYEKTFIIGYANGYFHYGAPKTVYNNGGYETIECMLAPEWEERYEFAAKAAIEEVCGK